MTSNHIQFNLVRKKIFIEYLSRAHMLETGDKTVKT